VSVFRTDCKKFKFQCTGKGEPYQADANAFAKFVSDSVGSVPECYRDTAKITVQTKGDLIHLNVHYKRPSTEEELQREKIREEEISKQQYTKDVKRLLKLAARCRYKVSPVESEADRIAREEAEAAAKEVERIRKEAKVYGYTITPIEDTK
jgi:hypothetical protein